MPPAASQLYRYQSTTFNATYLYNPRALGQVQAEQVCRDNGGHLVGWQSQAEQVGGSNWLGCCMYVDADDLQLE